MSRDNYGGGKRAREAEKARKKREKRMKREAKRDKPKDSFEVVSADEITGGLRSIDEVLAGVHDKGQRSAAAIPARLFVGGLSWDTTESGLRAAFEKFGPVSDVVIVKERDTGRSRGFGFVTMASRNDAKSAIEGLHETDLDGRTIIVNVATDRR
ncbi:MAG: RNA-binding protein [Myxococcota bacterium]